MIKLKKNILYLLYLGLFFLVAFFLLIICSDKFLTYNHPLNSKILVVEGWLASYDLELLKKQIDLNKYETIIVTGVAHSHPEYVRKRKKFDQNNLPIVLYKNGCLIIDKKSIIETLRGDSLSGIKVYAYGTKAYGRDANFYVAVNDSIIGSAIVNNLHLSYKFSNNQSIRRLKSIFIYFNNDVIYGNEDRNLCIDSLQLNGRTIRRPISYYKLYDDQIDGNRFTNFPFHSNADLTTSYLKILGVKNKIITLDTTTDKRNKTLVAARKFNTYISKNFTNINAFNIVSTNKHSRRSYYAYKIATRNRMKIGVISINDNGFKSKSESKIYIQNIIEEYLKFIVTAIEYLFS